MQAISSIGRVQVLRDLGVLRSIAQVDDTEARNGAAFSDVFRPIGQDDGKPRHSAYVTRMARLGQMIMKQRRVKEEETGQQAPKKEESTSQTPIGWLMADETIFGQAGNAGLAENNDVFTATAEPEAPKGESRSLLQPDGEWLLSPSLAGNVSFAA